MLIDRYDLNVCTMACDCHAESLAVYANLYQDMGDVLPYLNTVCPGAVYDHAARVLTWQKDGHAISLRPLQIAISDVADRTDAASQAADLVALINQTWERRGEIVPDTHKRQRPPAMSLYRLLPGGNCKACGESTCFIFAGKLSAGLVNLDACRPLFDQKHADRRAALANLLIDV